MFFERNVPGWERIARMVAGPGLIVLGVTGAMGLTALWLRLLVGGTGVILLTTGSVGWCPMCALAGRRINRAIAERAK